MSIAQYLEFLEISLLLLIKIKMEINTKNGEKLAIFG